MTNKDSSATSSTHLTDDLRRQLFEAARAVREHAYCVYSKYPVGAAILTPGGRIFTGCNVENAAFPSGICAERAAVGKAISEGVREFLAVAVVTRDAGSPCGNCRQVMYEFAPTMPVLMYDEHGKLHHERLLADLLPLGFRLE
jgi:cytidine deaminase